MIKKLTILISMAILLLISVGLAQAAPLPGCPDCPDWCTSPEQGVIECTLGSEQLDDVYYTSFYNHVYNTDTLFAGVAWSGSSNPSEWWSPAHLRTTYLKINDLSGFPEDMDVVLHLPTYWSGAARHFYWDVSSPTYGLTISRITTDWDDNTNTRPSTADLYGRGENLEGESFRPTGIGWVEADITELYNNWINNNYPNYGIALLPPSNMYGACYAADCSNRIYSSESDTAPMLIFTTPEDDGYNITSLECFDYVVVNNDQSCSVYVEQDGEPAGNVRNKYLL